MNTLPMRLTIIILALSFATSAQGQWDEWYVAPAIVYFDDHGDRNIDDSVAGGQIAVGRAMTEHMSIEGLLGYADIRGYSDAIRTIPDQKHLDISASLLVFPNRDWVFKPYVLFGIGYLGVDHDPGGTSNRPTVSGGLGFIWRMGQSNTSIRAEYRARLAYAKDNNLGDNLWSLGVQVGFGGTPPVPAPLPMIPRADADGDGVADSSDACPNTPRGVRVDLTGCADDDDGDRVSNYLDECPNTPSGVPVDRIGCSLDSDRDGVTSDKDRCPSSRPGADVDIYGCERDDDRDGVPNHRDSCPNTRAGVRIDVYGCEIKDIIRLPGVNFETGFDILLPGTEHVLQDAATTLNNHPDLQIEVAGHTDNVGSGLANFGLSERRAKTVRAFIIRYGVDEDRLTAVGYGEAQPISDNNTAQGRAENRRVELRIVKR